MKKIMMMCPICMVLLALSGCANSSDAKENGPSLAYAQAVEVLRAVADAYTEEERFAMCGGDQEHAVMDEPGTFDIGKTEEMKQSLGLPAEFGTKISEAASMVHLMNGNIFTGAAYRLKEDVKTDDFAEAVKTELAEKQWMCGQPDTMAVIDVDGVYVITAYGEAETMKTFRQKALSVLKNAEIVTEAPIVS